MSLSTRNKSKNHHQSRGDFSSILDETPWERYTDKAKPIVKLLVVVVIIGGLVYGGKLLFAPKNQSVESSETNSQAINSDAQKLSECIQSANAANPVPDTSDSEFYKKLINGYDQQLNCYAQYPNEDSVGKSKIEGLKSQALASSGSYADTYAANGGSSVATSSKSYTDPVTGCDYSSSESVYIQCVDAYNAKNGTHASTSIPSISSSQNNSTTAPSSLSQNTPSATSTTPSSSSINYTELNKCLDQANSMPSEASRARAVQGCYQTWIGH